MIRHATDLSFTGIAPLARRLLEHSAPKIESIDRTWDRSQGAPVFTVQGRYTSRGWTEWTQGFQFGSALLHFDATGDRAFLEMGRRRTLENMAPHVSHVGVHDHGFNNISTYGNLLRLMNEGRIDENAWERAFYELALKVSGAVQAARWSKADDDSGYIYSFNGPHSLFVDTIRSLRSLAVAYHLGHAFMGENDARIPLLDRLYDHADNTARYSVYYGEGRDRYDVRGRVAHESIFNTNDGRYRCPNSQQGYSPFSTWTRGLAWAICGFAEQLEFYETLRQLPVGDKVFGMNTVMERAARAVCDFYIDNSPADGVPYWDTGAPGLLKLDDWASRPSDPFNPHEPVDSSAAAIAAQGLLRLGRYLKNERYLQAGLAVSQSIFSEPYLSTDSNHQGILLHAVYHRPNGWDYTPDSSGVPRGESCMWGDYHALELAVYVLRLAENKPYLTFWSNRPRSNEP
ncbi:MAG: glycoside hydrolase family 88 protein [Acidobacteriaceae bacterium]|nr:glycoside hydrolase family 88 protein [Acidobacteriaceae bacterium]